MEPTHAERDEMEGPPDSGAVVLSALRVALAAAETALERVDSPSERRESVRAARRELKSARALAPLLRSREAPPSQASVDGVLEFSAKANQLLGPLRDRDALARSIQKIADRFADDETRRVSRTVLLATLVFADGDRRDDAQFAATAIERARRAIRQARAAAEHLDAKAPTPGAHASAALARAFDEGRDMLDRGLEEGDLAALHACRKHATILALGLRPFGDALPAPLRRVRSRAKTLAAALGEDRDFALLDVEMRVARARLDGSPLVAAIDDALRLARIEAFARAEDSARAFLRLGPNRTRRALRELF
ncbi:MAG: CHAD domain-containing protein [bacterium]